jgi:hypothetical protein
MAGLVLAGLAIGSPFASAPDAAGGLIAALSAFVTAWVLGFVVGDRRALIGSDAFTWTGAASLLGSVYLLSSAMTGIAGVARAALVLASAAVCFASWQIQAAHLEEGRLATPRHSVGQSPGP